MCMEFPEETDDPPYDDVTTVLRPTTKKPVSRIPEFGVSTEHTTDLCSSKRNPFAYSYSNSSGECRARCNTHNLFNTR